MFDLGFPFGCRKRFFSDRLRAKYEIEACYGSNDNSGDARRSIADVGRGKPRSDQSRINHYSDNWYENRHFEGAPRLRRA
jgi:hypothetical protein